MTSHNTEGFGHAWQRVDTGTVRVFRQKCTLEDAIGSHACSLEASRRETNGIPLGCSLLLPDHTVNCVQTLKAAAADLVPACVKWAQIDLQRCVKLYRRGVISGHTLDLGACGISVRCPLLYMDSATVPWILLLYMGSATVPWILLLYMDSATVPWILLLYMDSAMADPRPSGRSVYARIGARCSSPSASQAPLATTCC
jgi:hypothetical protein